MGNISGKHWCCVAGINPSWSSNISNLFSWQLDSAISFQICGRISSYSQALFNPNTFSSGDALAVSQYVSYSDIVILKNKLQHVQDLCTFIWRGNSVSCPLSSISQRLAKGKKCCINLCISHPLNLFI